MRNLKKPAASKRAKLPRRVDYARQFLKDWERLSRSGRTDMNRLKAVMLLLIANDAPLGPERRDHALKGSWARYRECHVGGDFLLIYRIRGHRRAERFRVFCPGWHPCPTVRMTTGKGIDGRLPLGHGESGIHDGQPGFPRDRANSPQPRSFTDGPFISELIVSTGRGMALTGRSAVRARLERSTEEDK